jgi:hypothetical protein
MDALHITETKRTPAINFDPQEGQLEISGYRSMPELSFKFYEPVIDWVSEYVENTDTSTTTISFKLDYFNTTSGKCFVQILKKLDNLAETGHTVVLKWYYEADDEDMEMSAEDLKASTKHIQLEKIPYTNE